MLQNSFSSLLQTFLFWLIRQKKQNSSTQKRWECLRNFTYPLISHDAVMKLQDQASSEMQSLQLVLGRPLIRFPVGVASGACLANISWDILNTWSNQRSWDLSIRKSSSTFMALRISQLRTCRNVSRHELFAKIPSLKKSHTLKSQHLKRYKTQRMKHFLKNLPITTKIQNIRCSEFVLLYQKGTPWHVVVSAKFFSIRHDSSSSLSSTSSASSLRFSLPPNTFSNPISSVSCT